MWISGYGWIMEHMNTLTSKSSKSSKSWSPRHSRDQWFHAIHRHWCGCPQFRRAHRFRAPRSSHTARLQNLDLRLLQTQRHYMLQIVPPLDFWKFNEIQMCDDMFIFTRTVCKRACLFRGTNKNAANYSILGRLFWSPPILWIVELMRWWSQVKIVQFAHILGTFWHPAIFWVPRSARKNVSYQTTYLFPGIGHWPEKERRIHSEQHFI